MKKKLVNLINFFILFCISLLSFSFFNFANAVKTLPITGCGTNSGNSTFLVVNNTIGSGGSCPATGEEIEIPVGRTLLLSENASGAVSISNPISGAGTLSVWGSSTALTLTGSNTLTGTISVSADLTLTNSSASVSTIEIRGSSSILKLGAHDIFGNHMSSSPSINFATTGGTLSNLSNWFNHIGNVTLADGAIITTDGNHSSGGTAIAGLNLDGDITLGDNSTANFNATNMGTYGLGTGSDSGPNRNFTIGSNSTLNVNAPLVNGQGGALGWPTNKPAASITKSGAGLLVLGGANTFTGTTQVSAGTLQITGTLGNGSYSNAIANSGTLIFDSSSNQTLSGKVSGTGALIKDNSGTLTLSNSGNDYTGNTTVRAGTLLVSGNISSSSQVNITDSSTTSSDTPQFLIQLGTSNNSDIVVNNNSTASNPIIGSSGSGHTNAFFNGDITLNRDVTFHDAGTDRTTFTGEITSANNDITITGTRVTLDNDNNDITGATFNVSNGSILQLNNETVIGNSSDLNTVNLNSSGLLYINGGTGANFYVGGLTGSGGEVRRNTGGTETIYIGNDNNNSFGGIITNLDRDGSTITLNVNKVGSGTQTLSGNNTYIGSTTISSGTLEISGTIGWDGSSADYAQGISNSGTLIFSGSDQTISGTITGTGALTKSGSNELILSDANDYTGNTTISGGTLTVTGSLSDTTAVTVESGATLNVDVSDTIGSISGAGVIDIVNKEILTVGGNNSTTTFSGIIQSDGGSSNGGITKEGTGNLTLSGNNTFGGAVNITAGTLTVTSNNALGNTNNNTTIQSGATIDFQNVNYSTTESLRNSGTISTSTGTSTFAGSITLFANSTVDVDGTQLTLSGVITDSATRSLEKTGTGILELTADNSYTGGTTITEGTLLVSGSGDLGTGTLPISSAGTLDLQNTLSVSSLVISGAGSGNRISNSDADGTTANLSVSGTSTLNGAVNTDGTQTYSGTTTLGSDVNLTGSTIALAAVTASGTEDLTITGNLDLDGAVTNVVELDITGTSNLGANVTTSGTQNYQGTTTLSGGDRTLQGSTITMAAVTGGSNALTVTGNLDLDGAISGVTNLSVSGTSNIGANVTTTGTQSYSGTTTLSGGDRTLTGSTINFGSNVDGGGNNIIIAGNADIDGAITNTAALSIQGVGSTSNIGADITTTGVQFLGNATLSGTGDRTVTSTGGSNITFYGITGASKGLTVDGGFQLSTNDATGLASLSVTGASTLAADVTSTGTQSYDGTTTLSSGDRTLTASTVTLNAVTGGSNALTVTGNLDLDGAISGVTNLSVSGTSNIGANVTTTGTQSYSGTTTLSGGDRTLQGSTVTLAAVTGGSNALTVTGNLDLDGAISGVTNLSVSGTSNIGANVTTTGTQSYSGTTTLSGGDRTLQGSTVTLAAVTGGSNALTVTGNLDLDGAISGVTNLSVSGTSNIGANVTTTGTQSYSGTTTLSGGDRTLQGSTVTLAAVTGGSNALTVTGNLDLDGAISGVTNLSVSGTSNIGANVTTTGTQSYSGTTTVSASSTLNGTEITAAAAVLNNNLNVTNSSSSSFTGAISGTGNLTKAGSGTLTLSGTNSYTGDTTISAGTLTVSGTLSNSTAVSVASGAIYDVDATDTIASVDGAGTVDIASSTTLTTGDTNDQELSGTVSGAGSLTKAGSGILTLSGTNSYSGNTTISAGTLLVRSQLGEGTYAGNISNSGDFGINSSSDQTLSGVISGSGTINKSGTGELTLTGTNTFNGTINVAGGTLFAGTSSDGSNDITLGDIVVKGGTLGGGGVIGGDVSFTTTGGTLAPGNSIGTLTVSGDLTLTADDTTEIEFNASSADKIVVNGNTTLAGTISLFPENTTYSDVSLTIVDASAGGTFSGTFATETMNNQSNLNGATWDIVYDTVGKTVKLDLTEAASSSKSIKDTTTINKFKSVATIFDNATTGQFKEIKDVLNSATVNSVNTELGKLKGTVLASTFAQPTLNHNNFNRALNNITSSNVSTSLVSSFANNTDELTLASLQDAGLYGQKDKFNEYYDYSDTSVLGFIKNNKNKSILDNFVSEDRASFIRTYGTTADRDNIGSNYTGYKSETTGILFGQQFKNNEDTFSGFSYGFTGTDTDYKNNYGESKTYSVHASLFRQFDKQDYGLNLISGMYISKTESERNVSVFGTSVNDKYVSDYWDVGFNQEAQYIKKINVGGINLLPSAKLNSTYVFKSDTKETGGDLALTIDNQNLFVLKPEIGLSIGKDFSQQEKINNEVNIAMFASQDHFIDGATSNARFTSGSSFNVDLPRDKETYYSLGLGYNFLNKETDTSLMANAFLMQNEDSDMNSNIFSLTFRKLFGEFGKGTIPPVIAKKSENKNETVIVDLPKNEGDKTLEELEKNIEIVLKDNPTEEEVGQVYKSMSDSLIAKRKLTVNDVYNNLSANCYAIEKNLAELVNYYNKLQLYKILDRCNKLSEPKVHLIAERLHQIQLDETTALQELYYGYLKFLNYLPFISFIAFVILAYEFIRRYIVSYFRSKNAI